MLTRQPGNRCWVETISPAPDEGAYAGRPIYREFAQSRRLQGLAVHCTPSSPTMDLKGDLYRQLVVVFE